VTADTEGIGLDPALQVDHLVVWLNGHGPGGDDPVVLDDELHAGFSPAAWVAEVQDGYADAVAAVVFDRGRDSRDHSWRDRLELVTEALQGAVGTFTGDTTPTSTARTRRWARSVFQGLRRDGPAVRWTDRDIEDAVLVVDELVSNVEEHAAGWLTVDLAWDQDVAIVAVTDPRPMAVPLLRRPLPGDTSGRGLVVVSAISPTWGVLVAPRTKTVWAAVPFADAEGSAVGGLGQ
jgi:anti-sigma regulatory factor (Ser/Thr protein kinase)